MTFSRQYLTYLDVLQNVGMTSIQPINYKGVEIVPLQFLKEVLPDPSSLAENYSGKTSIGCVISGMKNGKELKKIIYNICEHQHAYQDCKAQSVGYTTGVPASVAAELLCEKIWFKPGVINIEECDPNEFLKRLPNAGLNWKVDEYHYDIN